MSRISHLVQPASRPSPNRSRGKGLLLTLLICVSGFLFGSRAAAGGLETVPGRLLVKPKAHLSDTELSRRIEAQGARTHRRLSHSRVRVVAQVEDQIDKTLAALRNDSDIEFAERDYIAHAFATPNDPYVVSGQEWHLAKIQALGAWDVTIGSSNVIIAILDSGINATHPDLAGRVLPGYDFVNNDSDPSDDFGHGTAVAGTVGATGNNGQGVAGVAYGCSLLPVKVMDNIGSASHSTIAQGIEYAVQQGARIINLSLGGDWSSSTLQDAINFAWSNNVLVVAAAGNNGSTVPQYPGACDHVLAVAASEPDDSRAWFSTYGSFVTLYAPGDTIWTTQRDPSNPYGPWSGTSFSSPIVAATAGLLLSLDASLSNQQMLDILKQTADDLGPAGYDPTFAYGRVNAFRAVTAIAPAPINPPPSGPAATGPAVSLTSPATGSQFTLGTTVALAAGVTAGTNPIAGIEFYANGIEVTNLAAPTFATSWTPGEAGIYVLNTVAVDDQGMRGTSAPVTIMINRPELVPPSVTILSSPPNGARLFSPGVMLSGIARDNAGVAQVQVQVNNGMAQVASGTTNWVAQLTLEPGYNLVHVRSVDQAGNISRDAVRAFTYVVLMPLSVQTNGMGAVYPNLGGTLLEIGRTYRVRALPGPGQVFAGWTDGADSLSPMLMFTMQTNLNLVANFVVNPFPPVHGIYTGLMANTNSVTPLTSGCFSMAVTRSGAFSGRISSAGKRYGFSGRLGLSGDASINVRRGLAAPLAMALHVDLTNGTDQVSGSATDGNWTAQLNGDRNVFNAVLNPAQQAGVRSFVLERSPDLSTAAAGLSRIYASGWTNVRGKLNDGRLFAAQSALAKNGDCPFYLSLNRGSEVVIGWLNFPAGQDPTASGTVLWVQTGTNAFAATLQAASVQP